ncbi:MAG: GNAT family N-acetyltransferase [Candidatus Helarchaeota archaeon]
MIEVRTAEKSDIDAMRKLMIQLCEAQGVEFQEKRFDWGIKRRLFDRLQKHGLLIAEDSETKQVAGMIYAELIIDPFGSAEGYIRQVIIEKSFRGKGIGSHLLEKGIEYLKGMGAEVIRINATGKQIPYYEKFGFKNAYNVMELR